MIKKLIVLLVGITLTGCVSEKKVAEQLEKVLENKPEILAKAIEKEPLLFVESFQKAIKAAQGEMAKKREAEEKKEMEEIMNNPFKPEIASSRIIRGVKKAPITIVEYSDFECPYCAHGFNTVIDILKKYKGKVTFVYKHLPLGFHKSANISARYYEAIGMQSSAKAIKFHDEIYENQKKLRNGEKFLKSIAKKLKVNMSKLAKDLKSDKIQKIIDGDKDEAAKFGMQGTPGFLINGIPVRGALPTNEFVKIINNLVAKGKIKL